MSEGQESEARGLPLEKITIKNICGDGKEKRVCCWAPRREEIQRFVELAKHVHRSGGKPRILSIGCGSGFLEYLLALTGEVEVIGMDPDEYLVKKSPYSHPNLKLEVGDSKGAVERYHNEEEDVDLFFLLEEGEGENDRVDVVLNSWMPQSVNLTPDIRDINAACIIYVREEGGSTGVAYDEDDSDRKEKVSYKTGPDYKRVFGWYGPAWNEIMKLANNLLPAHMISDATFDRNKSLIDIQFRKDVIVPGVPKISIPEDQKYRWEKNLEGISGPLAEMEKFRPFRW